jgi:hypothetical protein
MPAQGRPESHFLSFPVFVKLLPSEMGIETKTDEKNNFFRPANDAILSVHASPRSRTAY